MHVLVTGGTGFIGSALVPALCRQVTSVTVLSRYDRRNTKQVRFVTQLKEVEGPVDAVINLAGASLAAKRWNEGYKAEMVASRVQFTEALVNWMQRQASPPPVFLSGSAIGYYGSSGEQVITETGHAGQGFAAELCQMWEGAALAYGTGEARRVTLLRIGVVLDRDGGALPEMMRSFKLGIGSWMGRGNQYFSWIHRADIVRAITFLLEEQRAHGPVNLTAPKPVTHKEFSAILSARKRTLFNLGVPGVVARALVGEMADELLLSGQRVLPSALEDWGFEFRFESLDSAFIDILSRTRS